MDYKNIEKIMLLHNLMLQAYFKDKKFKEIGEFFQQMRDKHMLIPVDEYIYYITSMRENQMWTELIEEYQRVISNSPKYHNESILHCLYSHTLLACIKLKDRVMFYNVVKQLHINFTTAPDYLYTYLAMAFNEEKDYKRIIDLYQILTKQNKTVTIGFYEYLMNSYINSNMHVQNKELFKMLKYKKFNLKEKHYSQYVDSCLFLNQYSEALVSVREYEVVNLCVSEPLRNKLNIYLLLNSFVVKEMVEEYKDIDYEKYIPKGQMETSLEVSVVKEPQFSKKDFESPILKQLKLSAKLECLFRVNRIELAWQHFENLLKQSQPINRVLKVMIFGLIGAPLEYRNKIPTLLLLLDKKDFNNPVYLETLLEKCNEQLDVELAEMLFNHESFIKHTDRSYATMLVIYTRAGKISKAESLIYDIVHNEFSIVSQARKSGSISLVIRRHIISSLFSEEQMRKWHVYAQYFE